LRNYPDVSEVFDRDGSDAMRWFLMSSSVLRGGNLVVTEEGIRSGVRELLLPLWSTYYFFALYAGEHEATWRTDSTNELDRYLLAKTRDLIDETTAQFEALDSPLAAEALRDFVDVLTNWYVRRSRDRFWGGDDRDAIDTLYTVLETVSRLAAPLAPLITEEIWRGLTGGRSVHLTDWPVAADFPAAPELVDAMDRVRQVASAGLALRKATGLRVRLPLPGATVVVPDAGSLEPFAGILRDELNLREVHLQPLQDDSVESFGITRRLSVNARALGPRVGKQVQAVIGAAKAGDWTADVDGGVSVGGLPLLPGEFELVLEAPEGAGAIQFLPGAGFVVLDTATTPELEAEGLARDLVRAIQDARKAAGLDVSDRIELAVVCADADDLAALEANAATIAEETLAVRRSFGSTEGEAVPAVHRTRLDAGRYANRGSITIDLQRASRTGALDD